MTKILIKNLENSSNLTLYSRFNTNLNLNIYLLLDQSAI